MPDKDHTRSVSESENPAIPAPTPKTGRPSTNKDWWPNQLDLSVLHHHSHLSNPMREDFDYEVPASVEVRVWDSSSELRYWVLPQRPAGTEGMGEEELAELVTRDALIGVGAPLSPGGARP